MVKERKKIELPTKYEAGFLRKLDGRMELTKRLNDAYTVITDDVGGEESQSHTKLSLIERFVFLEEVLQTLENRIATEPRESEKLGYFRTKGGKAPQGIRRVSQRAGVVVISPSRFTRVS